MNILRNFGWSLVDVVSAVDRQANNLALPYRLTSEEGLCLALGSNPFASLGCHVDVETWCLVRGDNPPGVLGATDEEIADTQDRYDLNCAWAGWQAHHRQRPAAN